MRYFWNEHLKYIIPVVRNLSEEPIIIDVGVGVGALLEMILNVKHARGIGLDISVSAIRKTKVRFNGSRENDVSLIIGDVFHLPFRSASFHVVICLGLIEHFKDNITPLLNVLKLVKKGRYAFISVPQRGSLYTPWKHWQIRTRTWPFGYEREFTMNELNNICKVNGLSNFKIVGVDFYPSIIKIFPLEFIIRPLVVILTKYLEHRVKNIKLAHMIMIIYRNISATELVKYLT